MVVEWLGESIDPKLVKQLKKTLGTLRFSKLVRIDKFASLLKTIDAFGRERKCRAISRDGTIEMVVEACCAGWPELNFKCLDVLASRLRRMGEDQSEAMEIRAATLFTAAMARIEVACDVVRNNTAHDASTRCRIMPPSDPFFSWLDKESKKATQSAPAARCNARHFFLNA